MPKEKVLSVLLLLAIVLYQGTCEGHEEEHTRRLDDWTRSICEIGFYDNQTTNISLSGCQLSDADLPVNIFQGLTLLKNLDLSNNSFSNFSTGMFLGLSNLVTLVLSENIFLSVQPKLLKSLYDLKVLRLDRNRLISLDRELFQNLSQLRTLNLSSNLIQTLTPKIFHSLNFLITLDLSGNDLRHLSPDVFIGLQSLRSVFLNDNRLGKLPSVIFRHLPFILDISLSNNPLVSLPVTLFQNLTTLQRLVLVGCSLQDLSKEDFKGLYSLQSLDLQRNYIDILPPFAFKDLRFLKELILLQNLIKRIDQQAFKNLFSLETLMMNENKIEKLESGTFADLAALSYLDIQKNQIDYVPDDIFRGLSTLKYLDMSYNRLALLPKALCNDSPSLNHLEVSLNKLESVSFKHIGRCHNLTDIVFWGNNICDLGNNGSLNTTYLELLGLSGNKLASLPLNIFEGLKSLYGLYLRYNHLQVLQSSVFKDLQSLLELSLGNNMIERLPSDIFSGLHALEILDLNDNHLSLGADTLKDLFCGLHSLYTLDLSNNELSTLSSGVFDDLRSLQTIYLGGNHLTMLIPDLFRNLNFLIDIRINDNRIEFVPPGFLSKITKLITLDLSNNNITRFPNRVFQGLYIESLYLSQNNILQISGDLFKGSTVEELKLDSNTLTQLPDGLFKGLKLQKLTLYDNCITHLPSNIFDGLSELTQISLQKNHLSTLEKVFDGLFFLEELDLRDNNISNLPRLLFKGLYSLKMIRLSNNRIKSLPPTIFEDLYNLEYLDLAKNKIVFLNRYTFLQLGNLSKVYLNQNQLQNIDMCVFPQKIQLLDLSENNIDSITCKNSGLDSEGGSISQLNMASNNLATLPVPELLKRLNSYANLDLSNNELGLSDWLSNLAWLGITVHGSVESSSKMTISYRNNKVTVLETVRIDNYLLRLMFDSLRIDMAGNNLTCDCSAYHMHKILKDIRKSTNNELEDRYLNTWQCSDPIYLRGRTLIDVSPQDLRCQENNRNCPKKCKCFSTESDATILVDCQNKGLTEPPSKVPLNTIILDLRGNEIESLVDLSKLQYIWELSELRLSLNKLRAIPNMLVSKLFHLDILSLSNNLITVIPHGFKQMNHTKLSLGGNVLKCDCRAKWLLSWILSYRHNILDVDDILCDSGEQLIKKPQDTFVCVLSMAEIALVVVSTVVTVSVVLISLGYTYRIEIKVFLYTRFNWHPFDNPEEQDMNEKLYDAFVSYSGHDVQWVLNTLQQQLETPERSYRLCMNDRDFLPGEEITTNIINGVKYSRKMIMILTRNFLQSEWCRFEFITAHRRVLKGKTNYLIVILFDHIDVNELDEDLKIYLKTNTYLYYADKWFWDKLMYAMPQKSLCTLRGHHFPEGGFNTLCPTPVSLAAIQNLLAREEEQRLLREEEEIEGH